LTQLRTKNVAFSSLRRKNNHFIFETHFI
jgi:hypothetical protein